MIEEVYKHMILKGEQLKMDSAEVYISKKSGLAKEDLPSFRKDLCLFETEQAEFTLKFEKYLDINQVKRMSSSNNFNEKSPSSSVATNNPY